MNAPPSDSTRYVGSELELFQHAHRWKRYFRDQIDPFLRGDVLEVGAGIGGTTAVLHQDRLGSWTCLEPDPALCEQILEGQVQDRVPARCAVRVGTLAELPEDERYDTLLYIDVLEHIEDDAAEFRAAASRLKPGGRVVILVPAHAWLYSPFDQAIGHFRRYDRKTLRSAAPAELELETLRYLDAVGVLASAANRLLMRQSTPTPAQIGVWDRWMVPVSRILDPVLFHRCGKSLLGVWRRPREP